MTVSLAKRIRSDIFWTCSPQNSSADFFALKYSTLLSRRNSRKFELHSTASSIPRGKLVATDPLLRPRERQEVGKSIDRKARTRFADRPSHLSFSFIPSSPTRSILSNAPVTASKPVAYMMMSNVWCSSLVLIPVDVTFAMGVFADIDEPEHCPDCRPRNNWSPWETRPCSEPVILGKRVYPPLSDHQCVA